MSERKNIKGMIRRIKREVATKPHHTTHLPWKWQNMMSNISKLTSFGQVEILRRV